MSTFFVSQSFLLTRGKAWLTFGGMDHTTPAGALTIALERAGGPTKLAAALGITGQAISQWDAVPLSRVAAVAKATGMSIVQLRPDVFGGVADEVTT